MAGWNGKSLKVLPTPCIWDSLQSIVVIGGTAIPGNPRHSGREATHPGQSTIPELPLLGKFPVENHPSLKVQLRPSTLGFRDYPALGFRDYPSRAPTWINGGI